MSSEQKQWFDTLTGRRSKLADALEDPAASGVKNSVVEKYSDQAHFIYELLQNADDVKATSASFRLERDGLFFMHNGSVRFTVSNPQNEAVDKKNGILGHINAITSIGNSSKTGPSIGKFGVGFKAVFQYTKTPHIYDPGFRFKIERFIVPHELDADFGGRKPDETVFWFPFDDDKKQPQDCRYEIDEKLKTLIFPTLFLSKLESISWEADGKTGRYSKQIKQTLNREGLTAQFVSLVSEVEEKTTEQDLWLFTRHTEIGPPYCIGYAVAEGKLKPISQPAFCFFPTKEATNLNFIVHAPFLLTDSRESIKAGERHNHEMVQKLARLAADALPVLRDEKLIDDDITEIIPYDEGQFNELDDRTKISFKPFYTFIKLKLQSDVLLPAADGKCSPKIRSYWASDTELVELISDEQLAQLTKTKDACWVFRSWGKKEVQISNRVLCNYIDGGDARSWQPRDSNLIISSLSPEAVLKSISSSFISAQSHEWLHKFYAYLSERQSYQKFVKNKPIFLDQDGNAAVAFDAKEQLVLFLPDEDIEGYDTVHDGLLSNEDTREFIVRFGVKKPSLRDEIYNKILPAYATGGSPDTKNHFAKFFRYFKECKNEEVADYINLIKDKQFLLCKKVGDPNIYRSSGRILYHPRQDLKEWFETKPDTLFLLLDEYRGIVAHEDLDRLADFLNRLGVGSAPRVAEVDSDNMIDGLSELLSGIDAKRSVTLWKVLAGSWSHYESSTQVLRIRRGPRGGFRGSDYFDSGFSTALRSNKWILNKASELVSTNSLTIQSLSDQYDTTSTGSQAFIRFLGIRDEALNTSHLSDEEARKIRLADEIAQSGLTEDEIRVAMEDFKRKKKTSLQADNDESKSKEARPDSPLIRDIVSRRPSIKNSSPTGQLEKASTERSDESEDVDDYTPKAVDYGKKLDRAKDRYASELDRIEHEQALQEKASALPRYSYGWFLALLELECMASAEKNADGKTLSIGFGKVERDAQSSRTIVLKEPSRFIPQSIEEFSDVRVDLDFGNGRTGKLRMESFTAREFSLLGKLESTDELNEIDFKEVLGARIEVQNPSFLLKELLERFAEFEFDEKYDMKASLTPDIEFVFGPPGTGKTTYLAEKVLIPHMRGSKQARVLVLTPTNKAADVLTTRIMEKMDGDTSYSDWLVRFGTSSDERIERAGVWRDRSFDISALGRSVTVTTVARFAYDGFSGNHAKKLYEIAWDAIVFDEASMISLANIIYPLYRQKSRKFIIAGDPFQIEPIVAVEQWKDENIYALVGLNKKGSFAKPTTMPHNYTVTNLEVQYRSIPAIGEVYSHFTYDGILKHHRDLGKQRLLNINGFAAKPLNIIKFPVSKYESIYRAKRLESGTPYQTYSALFTFEFVRWLSGQIQGNAADKFRIGVIAPYRAQANLLNKLNESWLTKPDCVEIQVGTIHGFQGDECDIIIAVFNPPPTISPNPRMFLNKQNILNVAISRARDYLFIIVPDNETEGRENLHKLAKIERLARKGGDFSESESFSIEELIWGNANYLEENTFSTGHQMVNVYRRPERYYEVRSDDSAIDVQIHERD